MDYILQLSKSSAVLVYGPKMLCTMLVMDHSAINVTASVDPKVLRALGQKDQYTNAYKIAVCSDMFGMRGIDYRSENIQLALVIA